MADHDGGNAIVSYKFVSAILWREETSEVTVIAVCATDAEAEAYLLAHGYEQKERAPGAMPWYERFTERGISERARIRRIPWIGPGDELFKLDWGTPLTASRGERRIDITLE